MSQLEELDRRATVPECPYVGLRDYTEEYAEFFFGRDAERKRIIGNLGASRLTLLYAESGVGKSSLLRAGVVPRLRELAERGRGATSARYVPVVFSSWGGDPTEGLIDAVADAIEPFVGADPELPRGTLVEAVAAASTACDATMLVILDQFEELFLYHAHETDDDRFAEELAQCINRADLRANFLISIREDAYASVGDLLKGLVANVYGNYLHLDYLDRKTATAAIVKPIERFNELRPGEIPVSIAPELIDAVLDQVRRGQVGATQSEPAPAAPGRGDATSIETTYLQLVMKRLWDEETAIGSSVLRLETLERLGGAQTIIGTHLDQAMAELPESQRDAAAAVFRFLVTSTGTKIALTVEDLVDLSGLAESAVAPMLWRLSAADQHILRPVVLRDSPDRARFEIFHDALARPILDWRTRYARQKLDAELDDERRQKERAQQEALDAEAREARERRRKRIALAGLAVAVVALLVTAAAFAISQKNSADRKAAYADSISAVRRIERNKGSPSPLGSDAVALEGLELARAGGGFPARVLALGALQSNVALPVIGPGHTRSGLAVAFVSNSVVASGSSDGTIRLWDRHARPLTHPITTQRSIDVVADLAVGSVDGRRVIAAARGDGSVDLWDVTRPRQPIHVSHFSASDQGLHAAAVSPDGTQLAVGGDDAQVSIWDITDLSKPKQLGSVAVVSRVWGLSFNTDGTQLAVADANGVGVLSGPDFAHATPEWLETDQVSFAVAFSPGGALAYAIDDRDQPGIGLRDNGGVTRLFATTGYVNDLAFAQGGKVLVAGGDDTDVGTWDVATGREFGAPRVEDGVKAVNAVGVSPDGTRIAEIGESHVLKLWPLAVKGALATTVGSLAGSDLSQDGQWAQQETRDLAVGPDGLVAAAAKDAGTVIWRLDSGADGTMPSAFTKIPPKFDSWTNAVAYAGDVLAVGSGDSLTTWRTGSKCDTWPDAACRLSSSSTTSSVSAISFDHSGKWLAAGDSSGHVAVFQVRNGKIKHRITTWTSGVTQVNALEFSPTADLVATGNERGFIELRDLRDPHAHRVLRRVLGHQGQSVTALAFSPDGRTLASGGLDQQTVLWAIDLRAHQAMRRLPGLPLFQTNSILALAFSPDGKVLAAGDGDGATCLYDVATRGFIGSDCLIQHANDLASVTALEFTPDGTRLLSGGDGNPVVAWDSVLWAASDDEGTLDHLATAVCRFAGRNLTTEEWDEAFAGTQLAGDRHKTCPAYPLP